MTEKVQASNRSIGQERQTPISEKDTRDMERRASGIFRVLADRKPRVGEAEALRLGHTRREEGDTNWMCLATAAELAKAGFEAIVTDAGETIIKKVKKG